jgi:hypothetical protein
MERSDERLSTRDLASGTEEHEAGAERDVPPADPGEGPRAPAEPEDARRGEADMGAAPAETGDPGFVGERPSDETAGADEGAVATEQRTDPEPAGEPAAAAERDEPAPLLQDSAEFQARWEQVQVRFVDEPRGAVEDADALVATVMKSLAEGFAQERERLEAQWGRGEDISTEDLRVALQRYRSFFQRLLST